MIRYWDHGAMARHNESFFFPRSPIYFSAHRRRPPLAMMAVNNGRRSAAINRIGIDTLRPQRRSDSVKNSLDPIQFVDNQSQKIPVKSGNTRWRGFRRGKSPKSSKKTRKKRGRSIKKLDFNLETSKATID